MVKLVMLTDQHHTRSCTRPKDTMHVADTAHNSSGQPIYTLFITYQHATLFYLGQRLAQFGYEYSN